MDWRTLGASVVVSAEGRPNVRGWLWRETPDGIYVALDKEAEEIRFVRSGFKHRLPIRGHGTLGRPRSTGTYPKDLRPSTIGRLCSGGGLESSTRGTAKRP